MNLIYEELIKQSKPIPQWTRTDQYQVGLTMNGTVQDPAFVRFVEKVSKETTAIFSTHEWILLAAAARGEKFPKGSDGRVAKLLDLGLIEKVKGRNYMLSRKYYEFVGKKGAYTRKKGLDREQNLALLLKHIQENPPSPQTRNPKVDPKISQIVLKCMQKDPKDRFQSVNDLYEALTKVTA